MYYSCLAKLLNADGAEITDSTHIGNMNMLRYRGYIYDTASGLYYLNARFYDPETGRFISMDDISYADVSTYNGLNLYAYCGNNPINYLDESGNRRNSIWKTLLGVAVGVGLAVVTVVTVVASAGTLLVPAVVGAGLGAGLNLVGQGVENLSEGKNFFEDINWGNVVLGGLAGAAFATGVGGLGGAVAIGATSNAGMSALEGNSWANIGGCALAGGVAAGVGYGAGNFTSSKLLNINTNLGFGEYINMARVDGAGFWVKNGVALMSKLYTMGPTILTGVTRGVSKFVGNWVGGWF